MVLESGRSDDDEQTLPYNNKNIFKGEISMRIIQDSKIDLHTLNNLIAKPEIFTKSTDKFWDDEHISSQMLQFHLNPEVEAASKTKATIEKESDFIIRTTGMSEGKTVIDLGCGPGLYVREFAKTGARVTGVDFSERSINYANENIKPGYDNVEFMRENYLELNFKESFDIATLIYYDFCALNTKEQKRLLSNVYGALKDCGMFILDVLTEQNKISPSTTVSVSEGGGFWRPNSYIEIYNTYVYEEPLTEGRQYTIIEEDGTTRVIRIYHRLFGLEEIRRMLNDHGFVVEGIYKNLKGEALDEGSETFGIVARKG